MAEAPFAAYNAMAGVDIKSAITSAGYQLIPGTNIQSDDIKEMDDLLILQKPDCRSLLEKMQEMMPETEVVWTYGYPIAGDDCSHHAEALKARKEQIWSSLCWAASMAPARYLLWARAWMEQISICRSVRMF